MIRKALGTIIAGVLALALVGFVPVARAGGRSQSTKFTFSQPVQLPQNVVLPSGTYWFEVPDFVNAGQIVQVFTSDHTRLLVTLQTIATERPMSKVADTQVTLGRMPKEFPMLVDWIYPGYLQGYQFVYSPQKQSQLSETGKSITMQIPSGGTVKVGW
jgi:hypothetical protein